MLVQPLTCDQLATTTLPRISTSTDGGSFHFCRYAHGEGFYQAIARHEHYLAHQMGIREGMKVLDVGCGVGGPANEIATFTGCHVTGLNNNDYQIERATHYAAKAGMSDKLKYVKGDFMVSTTTGEIGGANYTNWCLAANAVPRQLVRRHLRH